MRTIAYETIAAAVEELCIRCAYELPSDVLDALTAARERESDPGAAVLYERLLENARIAREDLFPLCQDTGLAVLFVSQGANLIMTAPAGRPEAVMPDAINEGVARGYDGGYLRKSAVAEPLNMRINTETNTPAIIHWSIVGGDELAITLVAKGGGCENKSQFRMFKPTAEAAEVVEWVVSVVKQAGAEACPPFVVGVGLGGDFELSAILAKKSLTRDLNERNADEFYARLEVEMLEGINALGIGPAGLGGKTTALGVMIETAPCHIASLPAAVNIECHSHRHAKVIL